MSWIAIGTTVASIGTSIGMAATSEGPKYPDLASGTKAIADTNAALLPWRRKFEAAARQGSKIELPGSPSTLEYFIPSAPTSIDSKGNVTLGEKGGGVWIKAGDPRLTNAHYTQTRGQAGRSGRVIDFTGLGEADVQAKIADEMAKIQLDLGDKYGSQFIDEALKQEKLADPEGFAAREKMHELTQKLISDKPDRPVAGLLDKQIQDELGAANEHRLTPEMQDVLNHSITKALTDRGGESAPADFSQDLTTGFEGEQRRRAASQKSLGWLSSGQTPEDVDYRREQQNLSNLSAEISGRTPQSQFASLSAAQNGPAPFNPGQALPGMPADQGGAYQSAVSSGVTAGAMNQGVNPWIAGFSGLTSLAGAAGQAGWKPFKS